MMAPVTNQERKTSKGIGINGPIGGRIQRVDRVLLGVWAHVLNSKDWAETQMLYAVNSASTRALSGLVQAERIATLSPSFSAGWHERADRERGRFEQRWGPASWSSAILQGPHLHVSAPLYKSPRPSMKNNLDWAPVDLDPLAPSALPTTSYKPAGDPHAYKSAYPHWGGARIGTR